MAKEYWSLPYVHIVSLNTNNAPNVYTLELLFISFTALNYKHDYRLANYYAGRNYFSTENRDKYC